MRRVSSFQRMIGRHTVEKSRLSRLRLGPPVQWLALFIVLLLPAASFASEQVIEVQTAAPAAGQADGTHAESADGQAVEVGMAVLGPASPTELAAEVLAVEEAQAGDGDAASENEAASEPRAGATVLLLPEAVAQAVAYSPGLQAMQWQAISAWEQSRSVVGYGGVSTQFSVMGIQTDSPLGWFASKLNQGRVTQMDFNPDTLNNPDYIGNMAYKLKLMYPLFDNGRVKLLADALALSSNALDFDALGREHELTYNVVQIYFGHALLEDQAVVLSDAQLTVDELKRMIEIFYAEGLVTRSDIAAADVELANIADEVNKADVQLRLTETTLGLLTGGATGEFQASLPADIEALGVPELGEMTALASEHRPDLLAMDLRVCAATNVLDEAIKKRNPTVGVFAEGAHNSPGLPGGDGTTGLTVGAMLQLDLDTGGVIANEIDQKRADLEAAKAGLKQMEDMAAIEVAQAQAQVAMAYKSIETFNAQAEKAAENLRVVKAQYREGLTNFLDLRMAITTHKESRLRQAKARHDYYVAYMGLITAAGLTGTEYDPFLGSTAAPAQSPTGGNQNV